MAELKRYSGKSLEEAMSKVNDALGPGAEIIEAKRVRRGGVLGAMKRDVVEVTARPRATLAPAAERSPSPRAAAPRGDVGRGGRAPARAPRRPAVFTSELDSMIDEIDLREERQLLQRPAPATVPATARAPRRFTDDDLAPLPSSDPAPRRAAATPRPAPRREASAKPRPANRPAAARPAASRPAAASARRVGTRDPSRPYAPAAAVHTAEDAAEEMLAAAASAPALPETTADTTPARQVASASQEIDLRERRYGPAWSEQALRELGVPEVVLDLVPASVLRSDLEWTVALEAAIRASLPAPTMPVAMCGYGAHSAVKILESMLGGCAMGEMRLKDRSVMATPFELALAVRQCLSQ